MDSTPRDIQRLARARMKDTGETYMQALAAVQKDVPAARAKYGKER